VASQLHHHPSIGLSTNDFELGNSPKLNIVRTDKVFTLSDSLVTRRIGRLAHASFQPILDAVCAQLNCRRC